MATVDTVRKQHEAAAPPRLPGWQRLLERYGLLLLLVAVLVGFSIALPDTFATKDNFVTILQQESVLACLCLGLILPIAVGEFDLSIGYVVGFSAILAAALGGKTGIPGPLVLVIVLRGRAPDRHPQRLSRLRAEGELADRHARGRLRRQRPDHRHQQLRSPLQGDPGPDPDDRQHRHPRLAYRGLGGPGPGDRDVSWSSPTRRSARRSTPSAAPSGWRGWPGCGPAGSRSPPSPSAASSRRWPGCSTSARPGRLTGELRLEPAAARLRRRLPRGDDDPARYLQRLGHDRRDPPAGRRLLRSRPGRGAALDRTAVRRGAAARRCRLRPDRGAQPRPGVGRPCNRLCARR